jgi:hypothetical protein
MLGIVRNTAYRPSTQASYTIGSVATVQRNQPAAQVAARHNIFPQMASYVTNRMVLVGIDPGHTRLAGGEIATTPTSSARFVGGRFANPQIPFTDPYSVYRH